MSSVMKKFIFALIFLFLGTQFVQAQDLLSPLDTAVNNVVDDLFGQGPVPDGSFSLPHPGEFNQIGDNTSLRQFILNVLNFTLSFLGLAGVVAIIYAGYLYIIVGGEDTEKAKKIILYACIGILVVLVSFALVNTLIQSAGSGDDDRSGAEYDYGDPGGDSEEDDLSEISPGLITAEGESVVDFGNGFAIPFETALSGVTFNLNTNYNEILWDFGDGIRSSEGPVEHRYGQEKAYRINVVASTDDGLIRASKTVMVGGVKAVFRMNPGRPLTNQKVTFDAGMSRAVIGSVVDYTWTCKVLGVESAGIGDVAKNECFVEGKGPVFVASFGAGGQYEITLTVQSNLGIRNTTTQVLSVRGDPKKEEEEEKDLKADFRVPAFVGIGDSFSFRAQPQDDSFTYKWEFSEAATVLDDLSFPIIRAFFSEKGAHKVTLTVTDSEPSDDGEIRSDTVSKMVYVREDDLPLARMKVTLNGSEVLPPLDIERPISGLQFSSESIDEQGNAGSSESLTETWSVNRRIVSGPESIPRLLTNVGHHEVVLKVSRPGNPNISDTDRFSIHVKNVAPLLEASQIIYPTEGPEFAVNFPVEVQGATDPDGEIVQYKFEIMEQNRTADVQISEFPEVFFNLTQFLGEHNYSVRVTVKDNDGALTTRTNRDEYYVNNHSINHPPKVEVVPLNGSNAGDTETLFSFQAVTEDEDGDRLSYEWSIDGIDEVFPKRSILHYTFLEPGTYTVLVTVTDGIDEVTESLAVTVNEKVVELPVNFDTNQNFVIHRPFQLRGVSVGAVRYVWEFEMDDGEIEEKEGEVVRHVYNSVGEKSVTLTVEDKDGNTNSVTKTIEVENDGPLTALPVVRVNGKEQWIGDIIEFTEKDAVVFLSQSVDRSGKVSPNNNLEEIWYLNGTEIEIDRIVEALKLEQTATIRLVVKEKGATGVRSTDEKAFRIRKVEERVVDKVLPVNFDTDQLFVVGESFAFQGVSPNAISFTWSFASDSPETQNPLEKTGQRVEHVYQTPGDKEVTLTVSDRSGNTNSVTKTITVRTNGEPAALPKVMVNGEEQWVGDVIEFLPDDEVLFSSVSMDREGNVSPDNKLEETWLLNGEEIAPDKILSNLVLDKISFVKLMIEDKGGIFSRTLSDEKKFSVRLVTQRTVKNDPPFIKRFQVSPYGQGILEQSIRLFAEVSDKEDDPLSYIWHIAGPSGEEQKEETEIGILSYTPDVLGIYTFWVTVTDGLNTVNSRQHTLEVVNEEDALPNVSRIQVTPSEGNVGDIFVSTIRVGSARQEGVQFDWTVQRPDGEIETVKNRTTSFSYEAKIPGQHSIFVTVRNEKYSIDSPAAQFSVLDGVAPLAVVSNPSSPGRANDLEVPRQSSESVVFTTVDGTRMNFTQFVIFQATETLEQSQPEVVDGKWSLSPPKSFSSSSSSKTSILDDEGVPIKIVALVRQDAPKGRFCNISKILKPVRFSDGESTFCLVLEPRSSVLRVSKVLEDLKEGQKIFPGDRITYTIRAKNPKKDNSTFVISSILPDHVQFQSVTPEECSFDGQRTVTCQFGEKELFPLETHHTENLFVKPAQSNLGEKFLLSVKPEKESHTTLRYNWRIIDPLGQTTERSDAGFFILHIPSSEGLHVVEVDVFDGEKTLTYVTEFRVTSQEEGD